MSKKNAFADKLRTQRKIWLDIQRRFTIQQCRDVMMITLHEHFGWGEKRCRRLQKAFREAMDDYILFALRDDMDDRNLNYTKGKMDEQLRRILKDETIRFEDRYPKEIT